MSEFTTDNLRASSVKRYSFGYSDVHALIGTEGDKWWPARWYTAYEAALAEAKAERASK